MLTSKQQKELFNWCKSKDIKILTFTLADVERLCPRVYTSNHGTFAMYEEAEGLLFCVANRCISKNWRIPQDFDSYLQVYIGYEKEEESNLKDYFYFKGCEFVSCPCKRKKLVKKSLELKVKNFTVYDIMYYFESTNLDTVFVIF